MKHEEAAYSLWMLLDCIDTLDDACKANDQLFRETARELVQRRWQILGEPELEEMAVRLNGAQG